jgi:TetR/AcrR family transcriptional regulator, mexJK operon transcriptional repressor
LTVANRGRLLRAATSSFLAGGYRISVDDIARRAGLAKQTVYHHFPSKDALFREVASELAKRVLVGLDAGTDDVRGALTRFAVAYRRRVLSAEGVATFRTLVPEVPRFPSRARAMYAASAGELTQRLAQFLGNAMVKGQLRRDDPQLAAEMLLSMLGGLDRIKRLFGVPRGGESEPHRAARIVDCFLRAYQK